MSSRPTQLRALPPLPQLYERHMELRPPLWQPCDFACLMAWMPPYLETHVSVARGLGKPLLVEETGEWQPPGSCGSWRRR